jgi:hypothetical protein
MTLPSERRGDRRRADALDRYWDSLAQPHQGVDGAHLGGHAQPEEMLDPGLKHAVRRVQLVDDAPPVDPAFAGWLWADLMRQSAAPALPLAAAVPVAAAGGLSGRLTALPRHRVLVELAIAAALLVAVLGGASALKLPVAFDPVTPTAAAEAIAPSVASVAAGPGCERTVTPEPTLSAGAAEGRAAPTSLPAPTAAAALAERC